MAETVKLAPAQVDLLNLVRAAAAQAVLIGHASHYFIGRGFLDKGKVETTGVLVFFLLSGFLISSSVVQKWERSDYRFSHYLIDRFWRIFSAYIPALIFVAVVDSMLAGSPAYPYRATFDAPTMLGNLAMLQEYPLFQVLRRLGVPDQSWFIETFGSGRPFWTVAIEWWIYLFFGYLAFSVLRERSSGRAKWVMIAPLAVVPLYNAIGGVGDCLTFVWGIGLFWAIVRDRSRNLVLTNRKRRRAVMASAALCLSCAGLLAGRILATHFRVYDLQFAMLASGILFGIFFALGFARPVALPPWLRRAIGFLADYSYSLYLTHFTILVWLLVHFGDRHEGQASRFWLAIGGANIVAILFWFLFERHHQALARATKGFVDRRYVRALARQ